MECQEMQGNAISARKYKEMHGKETQENTSKRDKMQRN